MTRFLSQIGSLRPDEEALPTMEKWRRMTSRRVGLIATASVLLFGLLRLMLAHHPADPIWGTFVVAGLLAGLTGASALVPSLRRYSGLLMQGGLWAVLVWAVAIAVLNQAAGEYVLGLLVVYGGVVAGLGASGASASAAWWGAGGGLLLTALGVVLGPSPQTHPLVLLATMAVTALGVGGATQACLSTVRDATNRRDAHDRRSHRAELQHLMGEISAGFIDTPIERIDHAIEEALATVGAFVAADRSYVFLFDGDPDADVSETFASNTHEWCAEGIPSQQETLQNIPCEGLPWWMDRMRDREPLMVPSVAELPEAAAAEKELLEAQNIQSLVVLPMTQGDRLIGFVGFDAVTTSVEWDEETVAVLNVLEDTIASALQRRRMEEQLREREERLRAITENVSEGIYRSTPDEGLVYANKTFAELFGYDHADEVLDIDPSTLYATPEDREQLRAAAREHDSFEGVEAEFKRIDGSTFDGLVSGSIVRDEEGAVKYYDGAITDITERRTMERRLREREARIRGLANSIPGVAYQFFADPDGTFGTHFVSDHAESVLGISSDPDHFYDQFLNCVPSSHREALLDSARDAVDREDQWRFEMPFDKPSGERIWLLGISTPTRQNGHLVYNGVLLDITERKEAERALRKERDRFETLFESLPTPVVRCTANDEGILIADVNEAFESVFGYDREEAEHADLGAFLMPNGEGGVGIDRQALTEGTVRTDVRCETTEGPRDFRIQVAGQTSDAGPPEGHAIYTDITARKRRERALEETNATLEAILENLPSGILAEDAGGSVLAANESFCSILGLPWEADDLRGRDTKTVLEQTAELFADPDRFVARTQEILDRGEPVFDEELCLADGCVLERDFVPYVLADGTAALWVYRDISDRKERERRLREAKDEAQEANRMKSVFLANMSHEIRTPLTSMIGFAEVIGDEVEDDEEGPIPRFAHLIEESGHRLLETLDSVLNLSKLEAGEMELSPEPIPFADEVQETAELFGPQAEEAGIDLCVQTPDELLRGYVDPGGLRIVLRNLISNALKYTEEGVVWVRAGRQNGRALIEVEDTGIGMNPDEASALFEAFRQESEGIAREYEGSGLGLAVTKRVVDQMDGTIEVETKKGKGSCFTVSLPTP